MSWVGLTAIIVLVAAALIGAVVFARRRGRISGSVALALMLVVLAGASIVFIYPSALTAEGGEAQHIGVAR
ncbi:hypothetical protein L286_06585 [Sphingobium sp. HDIP04]|uniref:Uncharacterized protein n=1 Tax=Sphingobium indicum F2 TaxID=1450518 RepID=A0A8E1C3W5_9SPHN|nr:hypothetical protein L286_06585 [Sphingobium sp. HDIP04]KER37689.1 hypothetical protein AL00_04045 [Sphingobium indicum F2]